MSIGGNEAFGYATNVWGIVFILITCIDTFENLHNEMS